ncbi:MAG: hypothetical protein L0207_04005 [Chlamydiae bacterium]|nr:hypothetical protein [Chlamydiota bacterium]
MDIPGFRGFNVISFPTANLRAPPPSEYFKLKEIEDVSIKTISNVTTNILSFLWNHKGKIVSGVIFSIFTIHFLKRFFDSFSPSPPEKKSNANDKNDNISIDENFKKKPGCDSNDGEEVLIFSGFESDDDKKEISTHSSRKKKPSLTNFYQNHNWKDTPSKSALKYFKENNSYTSSPSDKKKPGSDNDQQQANLQTQRLQKKKPGCDDNQSPINQPPPPIEKSPLKKKPGSDNDQQQANLQTQRPQKKKPGCDDTTIPK